MRILFLAPTIRLSDVTGDAIHVYEEVVELLAKGHQVALLVSNGGVSKFASNGLNLFSFNYRRTYESVQDLVRYVVAILRAFGLSIRLSRSFRPQVIYERHVFVDLGPFLSKLIRIPSVVELNGLASVERPGYDSRLGHHSRIVSLLEYATLKRHRAYVCVTNQLAKEVESVTKFESSHRVLVTGNGANVRSFTPGTTAPNELGLPSGLYVLFVGHLVKYQGLEWMIRAMEDVTRRSPMARLLIIGDGPELANLRELVHQRSLDHHILFRGPVDHADIPSFLRLASVCVSPAMAESGGAGELKGSSPIKIFEYMATGKPVILTRIGDISNVVDRERLGTVVEYGDTDSLSAAVCKYLEDEELSHQEGMRGREWVERNQSWRVIVGRIDSLLVWAIKQQPGREVRR